MVSRAELSANVVLTRYCAVIRCQVFNPARQSAHPDHAYAPPCEIHTPGVGYVRHNMICVPPYKIRHTCAPSTQNFLNAVYYSTVSTDASVQMPTSSVLRHAYLNNYLNVGNRRTFSTPLTVPDVGGVSVAVAHCVQQL